jgi:hypothetical protein
VTWSRNLAFLLNFFSLLYFLYNKNFYCYYFHQNLNLYTWNNNINAHCPEPLKNFILFKQRDVSTHVTYHLCDKRSSTSVHMWLSIFLGTSLLIAMLIIPHQVKDFSLNWMNEELNSLLSSEAWSDLILTRCTRLVFLSLLPSSSLSYFPSFYSSPCAFCYLTLIFNHGL